MSRYCAFAAVVAGCASAASLSNCGSDSDHFKVTTMILDADATGGPRKGKGFTVTVEGTLDEDFAHGTLVQDVTTKVGQLPEFPLAYSEEFEYYPGANAGPMKVVVGPITVPRTVPGKITVGGHFSLTNEKSEQVFCMDLDLVIPTILDEEESPTLEVGRVNCGDPAQDHWTNIVFNIDNETNIATTELDTDEDVDFMKQEMDLKFELKPFPAINLANFQVPVAIEPAIPAGHIKIIGYPPVSLRESSAAPISLQATIKVVDKNEEELYCIGFGNSAEAVSV